MRTAIKLHGKTISAWRLGDHSEKEKELLQTGKLRLNSDGTYEVFSREATSNAGEKASVGDYVKVDSQGFPYPNTKDFFEKNHRHIEGDAYEQLPSPLKVWFSADGMCGEIRFLMEKKSLEFHEDQPEAYFSAPLWGTILTAAKDAAVVFYQITYNEDGSVRDADFNFVAKDEFDKLYRILE